MSKTIRLSTAAAAVLVAIAGASALAQPPAPKISIDDARATALAEVPGKVLDEELEREDGRLIYSFEIRPSAASKRADVEVNIDANDGSVVSVETERSKHGDDDADADERQGGNEHGEGKSETE